MKKILFINQTPDTNVLLKADLAQHFCLIEASPSEDVMSIVLAEAIDLTLLDLEGPDTAGAEISKALKETAETRHIPLILLSTYDQREEIINGLYHGADDYLTRPFHPSALLARIDAHLRVKNYYADLEKEDLVLLLELAEMISVARNPQQILWAITEKIAQALDVSRCSIIGLDDNGELIVRASSDIADKQEIKITKENYPEIQKALLTSRPVMVQDMSNSELLEPVKDKIKGLEHKSLFVVPIIKKQNIIGTFFLRTLSPVKGGISSRVFKLCQLVANISGNALENAILFESMHSHRKLLEDLAYRDPLTGLFNQQQFHNRMEDEFSKAQRYKLPLSCVFVDLDNFKKINDSYGHLVGDVVLKKVAKLIKQTLRKSDIAARMGGDEFAILLSNTASSGAKNFVERLKEMVGEVSINALNGDHISLSVGYKTFLNGNIKTYEELLGLADKAMYQDKKAKKRVES